MLSLKVNVKVIWHIENKMWLIFLGKQRLFTVNTFTEFLFLCGRRCGKGEDEDLSELLHVLRGPETLVS